MCLNDFEQQTSRAGKAAAAFSTGRSWTPPLDDASYFQSMRSGATGYERRMYQRFLVTTRGYQKQWRTEEARRRATFHGHNFRNTRMGRTAPLVQVAGRMQRDVSNQACATRWRNIVGHDDHIVDATDFPVLPGTFDPEVDSLTTSALDFLAILGKVKAGLKRGEALV